MNGRLDKVAMTARIMKMKTGLYEKTWYPEWDDRRRGSAVSYTHLRAHET